jgi:ubiquinone biosynthesis protein COQ9
MLPWTETCTKFNTPFEEIKIKKTYPALIRLPSLYDGFGKKVKLFLSYTIFILLLLVNKYNRCMQDKREYILKEALKLVPFDGWTSETMAKATGNAGFDAHYERIAFPDGVGELVDFFLRTLDKQMLENLPADIQKLRIRDRIELAVKTRLQVAEPYKQAIRKTVSYYATHAISAPQSLWKTVDEMWYAAGDAAADFNHYTKRATLAGVYSSTLLYWLNDRSEGHTDTRQFLSRRIDNVMQFNKFKAKATDILDRYLAFVK